MPEQQAPMETILGVHAPSPLLPPFPQGPPFTLSSPSALLCPSSSRRKQGASGNEKELSIPVCKGVARQTELLGYRGAAGGGGWKQGFLGLPNSRNLQQPLWPGTISHTHPHKPISHQLGLLQPPAFSWSSEVQDGGRHREGDITRQHAPLQCLSYREPLPGPRVCVRHHTEPLQQDFMQWCLQPPPGSGSPAPALCASLWWRDLQTAGRGEDILSRDYDVPTH